MLKFIFIFFIALNLFACATSPTGRKQFILVSDQDMEQMGYQAFSDMKKKLPIEREAKVNSYVQCISQSILRHTRENIPVKNWEVVVFRDPSANAFALPGGKIGVHTGLLKVAQTADQLAAVIGHEIGHVWARHGSERVSQSTALQSGLALTDALLDKNNSSRGLLLAGLGLGSQFGVLLPFSRKHESEADEIGLLLMAKAGFDPRSSIELWQNMARAGGGAPPEILSTHPSNQSRISGLQKNMPQAMQIFNQATASGVSPGCVTL